MNRATFIKDFSTLGLELEDRVRLVEEIRSGLGLLLVTSPAFNGAITTYYAIMNLVADGQKDVLSIEAPIHWGWRRAAGRGRGRPPSGPRMEATLRAMVAVRPEVLMLSSLPDQATAAMASQLASSLLVVGAITAPSAARGLASLRELGVPAPLLAGVAGPGHRPAAGADDLPHLPRARRAPLGADPRRARHRRRRGPTLRFFKGKGCPTCNTVGYRGRRALFELLPATARGAQPPWSAAGRAPDIEEAALATGMVSMRERCLALVREGVTSFDEFARLRL